MKSYINEILFFYGARILRLVSKNSFQKSDLTFEKIHSSKWELISITLDNHPCRSFCIMKCPVQYAWPNFTAIPETEGLNERIRLFPCPRYAESHRPVSKRKKSCGEIQKVFRGEFRRFSSLRCQRTQSSFPRNYRRARSRALLVFGVLDFGESLRRFSGADFGTGNKRIPRNAERAIFQASSCVRNPLGILQK